MQQDEQTRLDLTRLERKLDRLLQLVYGLILFQPIVVASALLPDQTAGWLTLGLMGLGVLLLLFPRLERLLPRIMRRSGKLFGRFRRWWRSRQTTAVREPVPR